MRTALMNRASVYSPFERLADIRREMDRVFEGIGAGTMNGDSYWVPALDVRETTDRIECQIEVPGMEPSEIDVRIENGTLTISGEKKCATASSQENGGVRHLERRYGRFERSITLPRTVEAQRIRAVQENGVLTIVLPKTEEARARRIEIERAAPGQRIGDATPKN